MNFVGIATGTILGLSTDSPISFLNWRSFASSSEPSIRMGSAGPSSETSPFLIRIVMVASMSCSPGSLVL